RLALQSAVLVIKVAPAFSIRQSDLRVVPQLSYSLFEVLSKRKLGEVLLRHFVLCGNPRSYFRRVQRLHPTIRIYDFSTEIIVDGVALLRFRILHTRFI